MIPTQVFTPSKANVTVKNYVLNEKKVVKKLIDATDRDIDVHFEYKHGNIVLEFTPAAYLHFADCIQAHFSNHAMVDVKNFERKDKAGKIVETSLSVLKKENSKFQLYRINMYNSTMRVELNSKIREACLKLVNNTVSHLGNPSTTNISALSIKADSTNVDICPKCNRKCLSKCIECSVGNHWIHFKCEKLNKEQINTLEQSPDVPYVCSICTKRQGNVSSNMISSTSLPPPTSGKSVTSDGVGETQSVQKSQQINYPSVTLAESILSEEVNIRSGKYD
ncbi:Hypothetical predicted protein [Mytilus galloprovincialis]|uniref:Zinc finger PHD-type domain-containing protein n=1 Tax=Mytilus galloprovincialis TaxID=29158 RepID=A0A8B6DKU2_MYTGA|nr:Hypothetical predicted protein [Mytilus galloprovincialis]